MNAIFERTSIRKYTGEKISAEQIETLLKAAMSAPSARNMQPWEFIVVKERDTLDKIMEVHPYSGMLIDASHAIVVCGNTDKNYMGTPYWVQDCSAAVENILLQATDMHLGAVWLGVYPGQERVDDISNIFKLPKNIIPLAVISVGVPTEIPPAKNKFDKNKIHFEKW